VAVTANDRQGSNVLTMRKFPKLNNVLGVMEIIKWHNYIFLQKMKNIIQSQQGQQGLLFSIRMKHELTRIILQAKCDTILMIGVV
jgi:uncharacterized protein YqcC (DUF446 family)